MRQAPNTMHDSITKRVAMHGSYYLLQALKRLRVKKEVVGAHGKDSLKTFAACVIFFQWRKCSKLRHHRHDGPFRKQGAAEAPHQLSGRGFRGIAQAPGALHLQKAHMGAIRDLPTNRQYLCVLQVLLFRTCRPATSARNRNYLERHSIRRNAFRCVRGPTGCRQEHRS